MNENEYRTSDLALAAALQLEGFKMNRMDKNDNKRCIFVFEVEEKIEDFVQDFYNNKLQVDAFHYFNAFKSLKAMIYSQE